MHDLPAGATVVERHEFPEAVVEILEWRQLRGMTDPAGLEALAAAKLANFPVRQLRILLSAAGSEVTTEAGALQFWSGQLRSENRMSAGKIARRLFASWATGETVFRPTYVGQGVLWLEPILDHYIVLGLGEGEEIIVDQGAYHCSGRGVDVGVSVQKNVTSALFGGEGLFQTRLKGPGFVVLQSKVPEDELVKCALQPGEKTVVDGPFAFLRSSNLTFTVGRSARTWAGTLASGEGLVSHFENKSRLPGEVWVSPLEPVYARFAATHAAPVAAK